MPHFERRKLHVEPCWAEATLKGIWLNPLRLQMREFEVQRGKEACVESHSSSPPALELPPKPPDSLAIFLKTFKLKHTYREVYVSRVYNLNNYLYVIHPCNHLAGQDTDHLRRPLVFSFPSLQTLSSPKVS